MNAQQLILRNAVVLAKHQMKLTEETYQAIMASVALMSNQTYLALGTGEDVLAMGAEVALLDDVLTVDGASITPGVINFAKAAYSAPVVIKDVVLEGVGVTYRLKKEYPPVGGIAVPPKFFTPGQLPLLTDNLALEVTIQPGGHLKRAVVLIETPN